MYERYAFPAAAANGAEPAVVVEAMENVARTAHRVTVIPKGQFVRFRTHRHRFGSGIHVVWGIKPKEKAGPRGGRVYVHALLFDRKVFSPAQARKWTKAHGYAARRFESAQPKLKLPVRKRRRKVARVANVLPENVMFQYVASMNPVGGPKTINDAIKLARASAPSPYARAYADAAMQAASLYGMEGLRVQVLYLLSNLGSWRGPVAKEAKKFMKAWVKAQEAARNACQNPAEAAVKLPPRVRVAAKHRGITGLPSGAWKSWSEHRLATHFVKLAGTYGPANVMRWVNNIERWFRTTAPAISAKAGRVKRLVRSSSRYRSLLGRPRGSWAALPNPTVVANLCGVSAENPSLMILTNPVKAKKKLSDEIRLAQKAYKSFHFKESDKHEKRKVPDGWPKVYVVLGKVDGFEVVGPAGKVKRRYNGSKPILACTKDRKDVFIFSRNGKLGLPSGTAVRVDYSVPSYSGRTKWAQHWYHPHDSKPRVTVHKSGKALRINGPGLSVSPRGIIG